MTLEWWSVRHPNPHPEPVEGRGFGPSTRHTLITPILRQAQDEVGDKHGPAPETKTYIGGFWVLDCADMDEAVALGQKATVACGVPVEVRGFW